MHAINRASLILSPILAVAFAVGYVVERNAREVQTDSLKKQVAAARQELGRSKATSVDLAGRLARRENEQMLSADENERLAARVSSMEESARQRESHVSRVNDRLASSETARAVAQKMLIALRKEKDDVVTARQAAEKQLAVAKSTIENQSIDIADKIASIARFETTNKENEVLLEIVERRFGGDLIPTLQPRITGVVSSVSAELDLLTLTLESGAEFLEVGHKFAIHNDSEGFKGEATVTHVDKSRKRCFLRFPLEKAKSVTIGDKASTNLHLGR